MALESQLVQLLTSQPDVGADFGARFISIFYFFINFQGVPDLLLQKHFGGNYTSCAPVVNRLLSQVRDARFFEGITIISSKFIRAFIIRVA